MTELEIKSRVSGLRPECLPFSEVIAQSIANIAPTVTPTINAALVFASAGTGTWFTYVFGNDRLNFCGNQYQPVC